MKSNRIIVICQNPNCKKSFSITPYKFKRNKNNYCCKLCAYWQRPKQRFFNFVEKTDSCWVWLGSTVGGYGNFGLEGGTVRAHRFSYEMYKSQIPKTKNKHDYCVLHTCDNPLCVNPEHLKLGSQIENILDRHKKGRDYKPKGLFNPAAKLNYEKAEIIRAEYESGGTSLPKLAKKYGVGTSTIYRVIKKKVWVNG